MATLINIIAQVLGDVVRLVVLRFRPTRSVQAENLFLRRQLALFKERSIKPRRVDAGTRISLAVLGRMFDWRDALPALGLIVFDMGQSSFGIWVNSRPAATPSGSKLVAPMASSGLPHSPS